MEKATSIRARYPLLLVAIVAVVAAVLATALPVEAAQGDVLYVASRSNPPSQDRILIEHLEDAGYTVTVADDNALPSVEAAEGYDFVWISSSVNPGLVGDRYRDAQVPIGLHEAFVYDDMGMATSVGQQGNQTAVRTSAGDTVSVTTAKRTFSWGETGGQVDVVATVVANSARSTVFTYAEGATLADGSVAAGCRAGFFAGYNTPSKLRPAGFELFDQVIAHLDGCAEGGGGPINTAPTIEAVADRTSNEGDAVAVEVSAADADPGDSLRFEASGLPGGLAIDHDTGDITGTIAPGAAAASPYIVTIAAIDDAGARAETDFEWTVLAPVGDPNVVVIMTDDQTVEQMRWLPSVQAFMATGTEYTTSLVNYPLCGPSRVTFLTGQHAANHGQECNNGLAARFHRVEGDSLAPWLQAEGIHTIHVGKYLNGYGGRTATRYVPAGWDDWRSLAGSSAYNYTRFDMVLNGEYVRYGTSAAEPAYSTDVLSDHLDEALRQVPTDSQFFAVFTPLAPHYQGGKDWAVPAARHEGTIGNIIRPPNFDSCRGGRYECPVANSALNEPPLSAADIAKIDNGYQTASESLRAVDEAFARMVATLTELGRLNDTVVIFTSDNGFFYGEHGVEKGKIRPGREALFVPLYIRGPGFNTGSEIDAPVSNIDLAPTIVDIFGATPTLTMDGRSLLGPLDPDRALFIESAKSGGSGYRGVFAGGWLFYDWKSIGRNELYAPSDPYQMETLDNDNAWNDVEAQLKVLTFRMDDCSGADCNISWTPPSP